MSGTGSVHDTDDTFCHGSCSFSLHVSGSKQRFSPESGRGFTRLGEIKPDFAAPGVSVTGPGPAGSYVSFSGSSASAAITSGAAALFLQWGIQRTPARYFTAQEVKNYLIRGADRTDTITYPSREWGYGRLQLYQSFTSLMTN
ncbi:MAG: S8 family serine peptidase [Fusicatenibacter saccharivorans]